MAEEGNIDPFRRTDSEFTKMIQRQLLELREQFITILSKSVFHPDELETLTTLLAQLLFTLQGSLPNTAAIKKFWEYWFEPHNFVRNNPEDVRYIIYYKRGGDVLAVPAEDMVEVRAKESDIRAKGGKVLQEKIVPSPALLKELVQIVLDTASDAGLISLQLPQMNRPLLFSPREGRDIVVKLEEELVRW